MSTVELIVELRRQLAQQGLHAGADTIGWHVHQHHHHITVSRATIYRILKRNGLIEPAPAKKPKAAYVRFAGGITLNRLPKPDPGTTSSLCSSAKGGEHGSKVTAYTGSHAPQSESLTKARSDAVISMKPCSPSSQASCWISSLLAPVNPESRWTRQNPPGGTVIR